MRFGETLRYNANTEWWEQYLRYSFLKKRIKVLRALRRKSVFRITRDDSSSASGTPVPHADSSDDDVEAPAPVHRSASRAVLAGLDRLAGAEAVADNSSSLLPTVSARALLPTLTIDGGADSEGSGSEVSESMSDAGLIEEFQTQNAAFLEELEADVRKIERFYTQMLFMLPQVSNQIELDAGTLRSHVLARESGHGDESERTPLLSTAVTIDAPISDAVMSIKAIALRNAIGMQFRDIKDLRSFSELNTTGLAKILKKHNKNCGLQTKTQLLAKFRRENKFFWPEPLGDMLTRTVETYADVYTDGDMAAATKQLEQWDKRLVTFDKDTLWKDMLRNERKVSSLTYKGQGVPGSSADPHIGPRPKMFFLILGMAAFALAMLFPQFIRVFPPETSKGKYSISTLDTASRCAALLSFSIIVWATEAIPLYVTSLLIIPGASLLQLYLGKDGNPVSHPAAARLVFSHMASSTIMLVICVYALGAALSKFGIDKAVATFVLSHINKAEELVLAVLFLSVLLSVFVSNVAAPVLLISVLLPVLQDMPSHARPCVQCILFSVMIGSNIGGFASPISSPQSAVALGLLTGRFRISFGQWFAVSIPLCFVMLVIAYSLLLAWFKPFKFRLPPIRRYSAKFNWRHYVIISTVALTVLVWSIHRLTESFGSAGMVAGVPLVIFFGTGILRKEDFNSLPWDVVYLVTGGIVLGSAVESSKLLSIIVERLLYTVGASHVWVTYAILCCFMATIANAVSHTVSAIIILPLIYEVGLNLGHPQLLVMGGTIAASSAMALPVSSFPNISVAQVTNEAGDPYLDTTDLLKVGIPVTVACTVVIVTVGFWLMSFLTF